MATLTLIQDIAKLFLFSNLALIIFLYKFSHLVIELHLFFSLVAEFLAA